MDMFKIKSLQQRLAIFLLTPVGLLMIFTATAGFFYARNALLDEWRKNTILRLRGAANSIDMRLDRPMNWMQMYLSTFDDAHPAAVQDWLVKRLGKEEGVARVAVTWKDGKQTDTIYKRPDFYPRGNHPDSTTTWSGNRAYFRRAMPIAILPPQFDPYLAQTIVPLVSSLENESGEVAGKLVLAIPFDYLLEDLKRSKWWQKENLLLVDGTGEILTSKISGGSKRLGENGDPLELRTLQALRLKPFGTLSGPGHPPVLVSGFFRLRKAPWSLVIMAPGREILAPIIRFRNYYVIGGLFFILTVLLLIRLVANRTVSSIKDIATAADQIAKGEKNPLLPVRSQDEVGHLVRSFNTMALQLDERMRLKQALNLAMEVQQSLLPKKPPRTLGLDIAGRATYCDETGGDYYDFLDFVELGGGRLAVAVGDVTGHGIAAALIMTSVRSLLRSRITQPGTLSQVLTDVNRLLCLDTSESASFMTLFFMIFDEFNHKINWVRAGHEPAIIYDSRTDTFDELRGSGTALGVDDELPFEEYEYNGWSEEQILLIGTDGIWESENDQSESFGKDRLRDIIRVHQMRSAKEIVQAINDALGAFLGTTPQQDDITLVVIKARAGNETDL